MKCPGPCVPSCLRGDFPALRRGARGSLEVRLRGLGDGAEGEGNGRLGLGIRGDPEDEAEGKNQNRKGYEDTDNGEHAEDEKTRKERLGGITHAANFGAGKALDSRNHLPREGYDGFDTGKHPGFEGADLRVRRVGHRVLRPEDGTSRSGTGRFTLRGAWIDKRCMAGDWDMALGLGRRGGRGLGGNLITGEGEGLLFGSGLRGGCHRFGRRLRLNGGLGHRPRRRRGRRRNGRRGLNLGGARSIGTRGGSGQDLGLGNGGEGGLGWLNKLLGLVFALLKYALVIGLLVILFDSINDKFSLVSRSYLDSSFMYSGLKSISYSVFPYLKSLFV